MVTQPQAPTPISGVIWGMHVAYFFGGGMTALIIYWEKQDFKGDQGIV